MSGVLWWTAVQAVAATLRAEAGYRSPGSDDDGCTVYVAAQVALDADRGDWLCIAHPGDPDDVTVAGAITQAAGPMERSTRPRDERGTIAVRVVAQDGDRDVEATTGRAVAYLEDIGRLCRADPTFGQSSARRLVVEVTDAQVTILLGVGVTAVVDATLSYSGRV